MFNNCLMKDFIDFQYVKFSFNWACSSASELPEQMHPSSFMWYSITSLTQTAFTE